MITLQPVSLRIPNEYFVYSPSKLRPKKTMSRREFEEKHGKYPKQIRVNWDWTPRPETIYEYSFLVTAYSYGLDCWYVVVK